MAAIQRPDPVGYTAAIIDRLAAAQREQQAQRAIISEAQAKLETATTEANKAFRELHEELLRMDVAQSGNYGWEQRVAHFLVALRAPGVPGPTSGHLHHWHNAGYPIAPVGVEGHTK